MRPAFSIFFGLFLSAALSACANKNAPQKPLPLAHAQWRVEERVFKENNSSKTAYQIEVHYPELKSRPDTAATQRLNQLIFAYVKDGIADFKQKAPENSFDYAEYPRHLLYSDFSLHYAAALLKAHGHSLVSLRFETTTRYSGEATPAHRFAVLNYDLSTGTLLTLESLFKPGSPYLQKLADECTQRLRKRLAHDMPWMPWDQEGSLPLPQNFHIWNFDPHGLSLVFQEYQVTPYSSQAQNIPIPYARLRPLLSPASPVSAYAEV